MTYRERRLAKAERLREWAEKRQENASAVLKQGEKYRGDHAFNTQPGHIPERARLIAAEDRAFESIRKAESMESRADGIEATTERAIYDDDPDVLDRLRERIAELEANRETMKAANAAYRKGDEAFAACLGITVEQAAMKRERIEAGLPWCRQPFPSYQLQNLGGNLTRQRQRLARLEREKVEGKPWRYYHASKYPGTCLVCSQAVEKGSAIVYREGEVKHFACYEKTKVAP
jgi:hypothetical protein